MTRFSPSDAAMEGFRLTKEHPGVMLAWSAVYFGGILLIALAMMATLGPQFIGLAQKGQLATGDSEVMADILLQSWPALILVVVMTATLLSIIAGGVMRLVLRPEEHGFAHLRVGRDELRLTLANLVCLLIYGVTTAVGVVFALGAAQTGAIGGFVAGAFTIGVTIWIGVRLSLLLPTVFMTGRVSLSLAWEKSRGHFWPLFGMIVMAVVFYIIVYVLFIILSFAIVELSGGQAAMEDPGAITPITAIAAVISLVLQFLLWVLQIVMIYGPFAVAYRDLENVEAAADTF